MSATDDPRPLIDSAAAAEALRAKPQQLHKWADAEIITPARVSDDGTRWWNLHDLRRQLATYLHDHPEEDLRQ